MSKLCPYCESNQIEKVNVVTCRCDLCQRYFRVEEMIDNTVFHQLTESEETLAEKLVYQLPDGWWVATIVYDGAKFTHKETAIAATVARLKEMAE